MSSGASRAAIPGLTSEALARYWLSAASRCACIAAKPSKNSEKMSRSLMGFVGGSFQSTLIIIYGPMSCLATQVSPFAPATARGFEGVEDADLALFSTDHGVAPAWAAWRAKGCRWRLLPSLRKVYLDSGRPNRSPGRISARRPPAPATWLAGCPAHRAVPAPAQRRRDSHPDRFADVGPPWRAAGARR